MFKSTLGLGLGSTKKADLTVSLGFCPYICFCHCFYLFFCFYHCLCLCLPQAYLKNLEKKNREVQRRHSLPGGEEKEEQEEEEPSGEDSDLLSLAR